MDLWLWLDELALDELASFHVNSNDRFFGSLKDLEIMGVNIIIYFGILIGDPNDCVAHNKIETHC